MNTPDDLIDLCKNWVEDKGAAYLAKENSLVYYASLTGRKSDYDWHSLSLTEAVRVIRYTMLSSDNYDKLSPNHLIAACQELERVYEFGIKSRFKTLPGVFNYLEESNTTLAEACMAQLVEELYSRGLAALYFKDATDIYAESLGLLKEEVPSASIRNEYMLKYFHRHGYTIRTGSLRVVKDNKKVQAIVQEGKKPADMVWLDQETKKAIKHKIVGALK
jgi:hypothetical protein